MADDGFSPEMLDAYFEARTRQSDGRSGGGGPRTPWTADYIEANASAFQQALVEAGIDPNLTLDEVMTPELRERVLMAEGRERARPRFQKALDRAQRHGYEDLRQRIENLVEAEAQRHARRGMKRSGGIGSDAVAAPAVSAPAPAPARSVAPPLPVAGSFNPMAMTPPTPSAASPLPSAGELFQGMQGLGAPKTPAPAQAMPPNAPLGIDYGRPAPGMPSISQTPRNLLAEAAGD